MAKNEPSKLWSPGLRGAIVVDSVRGSLRVRAWPKKRGTSKSAAVRKQNEWFKGANALARFAASSQQREAIRLTKNSGLYPRDLMMRAMAGNLVDQLDMGDRIVRKGKVEVTPVKFQGVSIIKTSPQSLPSGGNITIIWDLPEVDTGAFWDVANPTRLVIPAKVSLVRLDVCIEAETGSSSKLRMGLRKNQVPICRLETGTDFTVGGTMSVPAIRVEEGDFFDVTCLAEASKQLGVDGRTRFGLNVLEAS